MKLSFQFGQKDTFRLPATVQTVAPNVVDALEMRRSERLKELGDWRPSSGWLTERGTADFDFPMAGA
jgi:hypothetical protein